MQIEFGLPNGAGGMAAAHSAGYLRTELKRWSVKHGVALSTTTSRHDHRAWVVVTFDSGQERDLTLFALTFTYKSFMPWQRITTQ